MCKTVSSLWRVKDECLFAMGRYDVKPLLARFSSKINPYARTERGKTCDSPLCCHVPSTLQLLTPAVSIHFVASLCEQFLFINICSEIIIVIKLMRKIY